MSHEVIGMHSTTTTPRTNDHHSFAQKLSNLAHTVQTASDEIDSLVAINKKRSLTKPEVERLCNLNSKLDEYDAMFWDVGSLLSHQV